MLVIGIETSGLNGSVALNRDGQCLESRRLDQAGRRHAQSLTLELRQLLRDHQATPQDVQVIAVSRGPGSFTGLRVGLVCAKTFAYATGCQFVAVDTLAVIAENCPPDINDTWVVEDAQRGDLFAGRYQRSSENHWEQVSPVVVVASDSWLPQRTKLETVCGRGLLRHDHSELSCRCLVEESFTRPRAEVAAFLGERRLLTTHRSDDPDFDFWKSIPFYIRPSAAEEQRDRASQCREAPNG
ncbi:MAG: tRNA (adenosine(37)-N6)-threonylcarbamoyltransferase complex dimerization subunit type 1 TsaB [Planctomycetes bacterium]|nr:tRNA (adenosine(37)-N6)-threonylcarbamoyltransferase complex dimerization subunit type 1 TsaB [Planctomycetota bacterium]